MYELPLFPLNTVLFPGMPLPLHIFEERYKEMINYCLREGKPFGVVLISEGVAERGPLASPHAVGCTAEIVQVQHLDEGRMLIMTIGQERFRIVSIEHDRPYLVGIVEPLPLEDEDCQAISGEANHLANLLQAYLSRLAQAGSVEYDTERIPDDPGELAYLAAGLVQVTPELKQEFLVMDRPSALIRRLAKVYGSELALMRTMPTEDQGIFSYN